MDSDYHQRYDQLFQGNHQQQQQSQMGSGLTRFRSAPSSFFANLLDRDFCEDILNRPSSPETEGILVRLTSGGSGSGDGGSPLPQQVDEPVMKAEARDFVLSQQQGQGYYQRQSGSSLQQQPDVENRDSAFGGMSQAGMDRFGQAKQVSSLTRHSSSPAGFFADINIDESGFVPMDNMRGDYGSRLGNNQLNYSSRPLPSSSSSMGHHMSPIAEEKAFVRDHQVSEFGTEYHVASWEDAVSVSENFNVFDRNPEFKASDSEVGRSRPPLGLSRHLSLPEASVDLSAIDNFLQMQDSVPCKIRAKRGFATHPRSIAERVRRTKISERMRKLQDLVPNMDKQTNTADMLDLAVDYVKELQRQVKPRENQNAVAPTPRRAIPPLSPLARIATGDGQVRESKEGQSVTRSDLINPISSRRIRNRWKRSQIEVDGRFGPGYRHDSADLLIHSFSEIGGVLHSHDADRVTLPSHFRINESLNRENEVFRRQGISFIDFDNKGYYLASVTRSGCLFVYDFETLYYQSSQSPQGSMDIWAEHVMHVTLPKRLDVVRWNIANQDEVACSSRKGEVFVFDVGYISPEPIEVLKARHLKDINGSSIVQGFSDIVFTSTDASRLYASSTSGVICIWDRRQGIYPCLQLQSDSQESLNSVKLCPDNQIILGAGNCGIISLWDVRGGRMAATSHSHKEVSCLPFTSMKVAALLQRIKSLQAQSDIVAREIHSIDFDPSCRHHLAFHLDDGWSGVLDLSNASVTHIHCPPPTWLTGGDMMSALHWRRPSWLPAHSIYVVGSVSQSGIHLLDFFPDVRSASRVDYCTVKGGGQDKLNKFVPLSDSVIACAVHPFDSTIIAGTEKE